MRWCRFSCDVTELIEVTRLFVLCLYFSIQHSRLLSEQSQLKEEMEVLNRENAKLVREHNHLKQSCEELKRLHSEDQREVADMRLQQQQVQALHIIQGCFIHAQAVCKWNAILTLTATHYASEMSTQVSISDSNPVFIDFRLDLKWLQTWLEEKDLWIF